jgi:hypothetical protein
MKIVQTLTVALLFVGTPGFAAAQSMALQYKAPNRPAHYDVPNTKPAFELSGGGPLVFDAE